MLISWARVGWEIGLCMDGCRSELCPATGVGTQEGRERRKGRGREGREREGGEAGGRKEGGRGWKKEGEGVRRERMI